MLAGENRRQRPARQAKSDKARKLWNEMQNQSNAALSATGFVLI
jgi:hypothetical protein